MHRKRGSQVAKRLAVSLVLLMTTGSMASAGGLWENLSANPVLSEHGIFANAVVIEENELDELRGGFSISGLDLNFGATMRSMVDGILYQTVMDISKTGAHVISQSLIDPTGQAVIVNPQGGQSIVELTPSTIDVPGLESFSGIALNDQNGFTSVLHNVTRNAIVGSVVSNASGREIVQEFNVDIQVNNIDALRNASSRSMILNSLSR